MTDKIFSTPDLCDANPSFISVLEPVFINFGGRAAFYGQVVTVKCFEDNSKVKELASKKGFGKVMVIDGGGSLKKSLLGDLIAQEAIDNGWEGFIINGCVRDVEVISKMNLGVKALRAIPLKTEKLGVGEINVPVVFAGQKITTDDYVYADDNGIIISSKKLI